MLDEFYNQAAGKRFEKYGEFPIIDKIAAKYSYSHDQVFNLSWREVFTMVALGREEAYVENLANEMKRNSENN